MKHIRDKEKKRLYDKEYNTRQEVRLRHKLYRQSYYQEHKTEYRERNRIWRLAHPEENRGYHQKYRLLHPRPKHPRKIRYPQLTPELILQIRVEYLHGALAINLSKKYEIHISTLYDRVLTGLPKHNKQNPLIPLPLLPKDRDFYEMLGLVLGDGWIGKYTVGFCSKDLDLIDFIHTIFKRYNPNARKYLRNRVQNMFGVRKPTSIYETKIDSIAFSALLTSELQNINFLQGVCLEGFVDGLMSAEGSISKSTLAFAQSEPRFSHLAPILRKVLGNENNITTNQNDCKQMHWSVAPNKTKPIFTHCRRKKDRLINNSARYTLADKKERRDRLESKALKLRDNGMYKEGEWNSLTNQGRRYWFKKAELLAAQGEIIHHKNGAVTKLQDYLKYDER